MKPKNYENINPVAQMLIDYFNGKVDDYILEQLTDCFVGFTSNMQGKMVKYFIDDFFCFNIPLFKNNRYTGVQHIDDMLVEMVKMVKNNMVEQEFRH